MAKREFDSDVEADRQLALRYYDELDSDEVADSSGDDNISVASEEDDDVLPIDEDNQYSADSDSDEEPLPNLRAKYLRNPSYISKKKTVWNLDPPVGPEFRQNTVKNPSGLTTASENILDLVSCFKLFMCGAMVDKIVQLPTKEPLVDTTEMYAVIELLITAGAMKANREPIQFLWSKNPKYCRPIFTVTMSRTRFGEILSNMRFDDLTTRTARRQQNKIAAIREIFEMFVEHCKENYGPSFPLTVDDQLVGFRGKCFFRVYMKSKPAKYGITI
ncbi:hypothetical protein JTB14_019255 [Gonioctena quinquepunctata]|nr:hypothetical protein JTB14_019255 [Gonioctena quinquepunctata]